MLKHPINTRLIWQPHQNQHTASSPSKVAQLTQNQTQTTNNSNPYSLAETSLNRNMQNLELGVRFINVSDFFAFVCIF